MAEKIKFVISEQDFEESINNIGKNIDYSLDKKYLSKFKSTLDNIFTELNLNLEKGINPEQFDILINNSIETLANLLIPNISKNLYNVINLSISLLENSFKNKELEEINKQKSNIEEINKKLKERNNLLEIARELNNFILDTTSKQLEFQKDSAELLSESLGIELNADLSNTEEILNEYNSITKELNNLVEQQNQLQENLNNNSIINNIGNWVNSLLGKDNNEELIIIEKEIEMLEIQKEQYKELATLLNNIQKLKKREIEERYKEKELLAELDKDELEIFKIKLDYYNEMLNRSKELGLSKLEELELERNIQNLIEKRIDNVITQYDKEQKLIIKKAELNGATTEELNQLRIKALDNLIETKQKEIEELGLTIERETELIDLELERLSIQKEMNKELNTQGILYDENIRTQMRSLIELRKKGADINDNNPIISNLVNTMYGKGLNTAEISNILGIDNLPIISQNNLSNNFDLPELPEVPELSQIKSLNDINNLTQKTDETNKLIEKELNELQLQNELIIKQNLLLKKIDDSIINNQANFTSYSGFENTNNNKTYDITPSQWLRFFNEIDRKNKK